MNKNEKELLDMIESKFKGKELLRFKELLVIDADTYLEEKIKAFSLKDVSHRRELLKRYNTHLNKLQPDDSKLYDKDVDEFLEL